MEETVVMSSGTEVAGYVLSGRVVVVVGVVVSCSLESSSSDVVRVGVGASGTVKVSSELEREEMSLSESVKAASGTVVRVMSSNILSVTSPSKKLVTSGTKVLTLFVSGVASVTRVMTTFPSSPSLMANTLPEGASVVVAKFPGGVVTRVVSSDSVMASVGDVVMSSNDVKSCSSSCKLIAKSSVDSVIPAVLLGDVIMVMSAGDGVVLVELSSPVDTVVVVLPRLGVRVVTLFGSCGNVVDVSSCGSVRMAMASSEALVMAAESLTGCVVAVPCFCGAVVVVVVEAVGGEVALSAGVVGEGICRVDAAMWSPMGVVNRLVPPSAAGVASFKKLSWTGAIIGMPPMVCREVSLLCWAEETLCCCRKALSSALLLKDLQ